MKPLAESGTGQRSASAWASPNVRGALWMLTSAVFFTGLTSLVKHLSSYSAPLQTFFSQSAALLLLLPVIIRSRGRVFGTSHMGLLITRAILAVVSIMLYYYSFHKLPLAEANALSFTRALWIAPLAALFLREHIGLSRWLALALGFAGVCLMGEPFSEGGSLSWAHVAGVLSALLLACSVVGLKFLTRHHGATSILCWASVLGCLLSIPGAIAYWQTPPLPDLILLLLVGVLSLGAHAAYVQGMAAGEATVMGLIDYSRLVLAAIVGLVVFDEAPGPWALVGSAVIVVATLLIPLKDYLRAKAASGHPLP